MRIAVPWWVESGFMLPEQAISAFICTPVLAAGSQSRDVGQGSSYIGNIDLKSSS